MNFLPAFSARLAITTLLACCSCMTFAAAEKSGTAILSTFAERHQVPHEMEQLTVKLINENGDEELREMRRYSRRYEDGTYRHLVVVDKPPEIAGVAVLAWQVRGEPDLFWSHMPSEGRTRKRVISRGGGRSYFMGTDLTNEDISGEDITKFIYQRMPDQKQDGADVFVIRATPGNKLVARDSAYQYRELFLRKDNYALVRIDYFGHSGRFIKRLQAVTPPVQIQDQAWRVNHFIVDNRKARHKTEFIVRKRELEAIAVPAPLFEEKNLGRHSALVKLRN